MKKLIVSLLTFLSAGIALGGNVVVIAKDSKVFETPIAKDEYAALNKDDVAVILKSGMAFPLLEQKGGWYVVEYTPGLRGMVMQNVIAADAIIKTPAAGLYKVANNPNESVTVTNNGNSWNLKSGDKTFSGSQIDNTVIFCDSNGVQKYSLVNISGKPLVFNYDNSVTLYY